MILGYSRVPTPIGDMESVYDQDALLALEFEDHRERTFAFLASRHGAFELDAAAGDPLRIADGLDRYFEGDAAALDDIPVRAGGTSFQEEVWRALRRIPAGETTTYGALANALGRPSAQRAVGAANGANPISIVVPCHRVVGHAGDLTGYGGGIDRKRWLLEHERKARAARAA